MDDHIALLGVKGGPAIRPGSNMPTSILLRIGGQTILVDAGLGVTKSVCDQGVALTDIDTIIITHLHSDHYLELGPLIHTAWVAGRTRPFTIYGPVRLRHYLDHFTTSMIDDIDLRIADEGRVDFSTLMDCHALDDQMTLHIGDISVVVMANDHPPIKESYALKFEWSNKKLVLSGDTTFMPAMIDFAQDADLLVHEAILPEGVDLIIKRLGHSDDRLRTHLMQSHTTAEDVGRIARDAKVKKLALHHFVPDGFAEFNDQHWIDAIRRTAPSALWPGELILGRDALKIDV